MTVSEARKIVEEDDKAFRDELFGELLAEFHHREKLKQEGQHGKGSKKTPKGNGKACRSDFSVSAEHESQQTA